MRLLEFRFAKTHNSIALGLGRKIQDLFSADEDREVKVISSSRESGPRYVLCGIESVARIAHDAFQRSFSSETQYGDEFAISSVGSCRFVVFDDGGLVRICVSNEDRIDFFDEFDVEGEDASELLISTDIFEYL